ncbi:TPA: phosphate uptake regulator PhoU, partial [Candidatus Bathyarchaeota archaeon]|nr:phosphate uptake regulator PhoU [Candidatus Bathyarchaeota archaeon]
MEFRRVQETGGGTFIVSLPKEWAARNSIRRGSVVAVHEQPDGRLLIDPAYERPAQPTETVVEYPAKADHIAWAIIGAYLGGYDVIRVQGEKRIAPDDRELIARTIRRLVGLEIIDEDACSISAQCILDPSLLAPRKILRRMSVITGSMQEEAMASILENDGQLARSVISRDDEVDRLYFLAVRLLRSAVLSSRLASEFDISPISCLDYRVAAHLIESIGDYSVQIAERAVTMPKQGIPGELEPPLRALSEMLSKMQDLAVGSLLTERPLLSMKMELHEQVRSLSSELIEKLDLLNGAIARQPESLIPQVSGVSSLL